jgi:uncharacterized membrane protein YhaH (DUF805 family)/RNA polymerase subunit RPABC4/transcription elongation factor Spt4
MTKLCQKCNKEFDNEVDFCPYCGNSTVEVKEEPKELVCHHCGTQLVGDEDFCPNCGSPIVEVKETPACPYCGMPLEGDEDHCPVCGMEIISYPSEPLITEKTSEINANNSHTTFVNQLNSDVTHSVVNSEAKGQSTLQSNPSKWKFSFKGRLNRSQYIICSFAWGLIYLTFGFALKLGIKSPSFCVIWLLLYIIPRIYSLGFDARRCHDFNQSGGWAILGIVPFISQIFMIVLWLIPSTHGDNEYGPEPKHP